MLPNLLWDFELIQSPSNLKSGHKCYARCTSRGREGAVQPSEGAYCIAHEDMYFKGNYRIGKRVNGARCDEMSYDIYGFCARVINFNSLILI